MAELTLGELAARIPPHVAQRAIVNIYEVIGREDQWDSGTIERVLDCLLDIHPHMGFTRLDLSGPGDVPNPYSHEEAAQAFWLTISED